MMTVQNEKQLINEFVNLIRTVEDDGKEMFTVIDFFSILLRYKVTSPPAIEMVTILKHHKPNLYHHLRRRVSANSPMFFVIQLETQYELALERLKLEPHVFG
jgi:hypothetical protein